MLYGRSVELARIDRLLNSARDGGSDILIIRGKAGTGKTASLDHAEQSAHGLRVLRCVGIESEREIEFASLQLMLRDAVDRIDELPTPRAVALRRAMRVGEAMTGRERMLVGMAVVSLLELIAQERPVLCLIDDMHHLDRASADAIAFVARRIQHLRVSMLGASRAAIPPRHGPLPSMYLAGLDRASATELLAERATDLSDRARTMVIERSDGNPLALIELARALTPEERAGDLSPFALRCGTHVEFVAAIRRLPAQTVAMLALAAADCGALENLLLAAETLGLSMADLGPAEDERLVRLTERSVVFRHPLIRASVYRVATLNQRLAAHKALASVLESSADAATRAWHLALSTTAPDERIAAELERAAPDCGDAAAETYRRAARLTPDWHTRARRLVRGSRAACAAGRPSIASDLADEAARVAEAGRTAAVSGSTMAVSGNTMAVSGSATAESEGRVPGDGSIARVLADIIRARAEIEFQCGATHVACRDLIDGARLIADGDPAGAGAMLTQALRRAWLAADVALAAECADLLTGVAPREPAARLAHGLVALLKGDHASGYAGLRCGLSDVTASCTDELLVGWAHLAIADTEAACAAAGPVITRVESTGVDRLEATHILLFAKILAGCHDEAATHIRDAVDRGPAGGAYHGRVVDSLRAVLTAISGDDALLAELADARADTDDVHGCVAKWARGLLLLGRGNHGGALDDLSDAGHPLIAWRLQADRIEAAVRCGRSEQPGSQLAELRGWARHVDTPWVHAMVMRCRGLVGQDEEHLRAAVEISKHAEQPFEHARCLLAYGECLRRSRQRARAREYLRRAADLFDGLGARPWADHARVELRAAGDVRQVAPGSLTPQEQAVVRLAATGATNREIATTLFLSPRTVGYHLYKAYPKLGVGSRRELLRLVPTDGEAVPRPRQDDDAVPRPRHTSVEPAARLTGR